MKFETSSSEWEAIGGHIDCEERDVGLEQFRALVQLSTDPIVLHSNRGVMCLNDAAVKLLAASSASQVEGCYIDELIRVESRLAFQRWLAVGKQVAMGGVPGADWKMTHEAEFVGFDGALKAVQVGMAQLTVGKQSVTQFLLKPIHAQTKSPVPTTSRECCRRLEQRLYEAQKDEGLSLMMGSIAHDFNNLLMGMLGNLSFVMIEMGEESPLLEAIRDASEAAEESSRLIRELVAYSGRGDRSQVSDPFELSSLVEKMFRMARALIPHKIDVQLDAQEKAPVEGEKTQIRQVVLNLILNAADAIGRDRGTIVVRTGIMRASNGYLRRTAFGSELSAGAYSYVEVEDSGSGMEEETIEKIFDPFFSTKSSGRGLGLAAVRGIVSDHGGTIEIKSKPGVGSIFRLLLPTSKSANEARDTSPGLRALGPFQGTGEVLVVDDDHAVRAVALRLLSHFGYDATAVESGTQAIEIVKNRKEAFDLILLDMSMADMDGEQALRELRRYDPQAKVVLMSGHSSKVMDRFNSKELAGFIQKPWTPEGFIDTLRHVISGGSRPKIVTMTRA